MPDETAQQKAERHARLSHTMGVMFLQHKVDKLQRDASNITYPHGMHKSKSAPPSRLASSSPRHEALQACPKPRAETAPRLSSSTAAHASVDSPSASAHLATAVRLVDASVLIFSLRSVHNWSRHQSTCVIIPLEAINTLDLLKKGDQPINLAARKATRWLEHNISISAQHADAMLTHPLAGIFAQKEHFRATTAHIQNARAAALASLYHSTTHGADRALAQQMAASPLPKDMFSVSHAPRYLRELLSVCLYCHQAVPTAANYAVAIAYPPAHLQQRMMQPQTANQHTPSYLNRTDARATQAWLDAYHIPFQVVPTSNTWTREKPSSRFTTQIVASYNADSPEHMLGSNQECGAQHRTRRSPTPSTSSSTGSFRSELSALSLLGSHKSPPHPHESRFANTTTAPLSSLTCFSTCATASATATPATHSCSLTRSALDAQEHQESDNHAPIFARPSSAASSHTSFVSSLTTSTQHNWSSQTSASFSSHCGTRIVRHARSPTPSTSAPDPRPASNAYPVSSAASETSAASSSAPTLTSRTLHKTRSGADKMEEYLRRLEVGTRAGVNADRRTATATATATPTPGGHR